MFYRRFTFKKIIPNGLNNKYQMIHDEAALFTAADNNDIESAKKLIKIVHPINYDISFYRACNNGQNEIVKLFLQVDNTEYDCVYAAKIAASNGHLDTLKIIMSDYRYMTNFDNDNGNGNGNGHVYNNGDGYDRTNILALASANGHLHIVKELLKKEYKFNNYEIRKAIIKALKNYKLNIIIELMNDIRYYPDVFFKHNFINACIKYNDTPIKCIKEILCDNRIITDPIIYKLNYTKISEISNEQQLIYLLDVPEEICDIVVKFCYRDLINIFHY
jgi:hypothetical protein